MNVKCHRVLKSYFQHRTFLTYINCFCDKKFYVTRVAVNLNSVIFVYSYTACTTTI